MVILVLHDDREKKLFVGCNDNKDRVNKQSTYLLRETSLGYDEDNFSGKYSRGIRYNIYLDGYLAYKDVSEDEVDYICDREQNKPWEVDIKVEEID